MRGTKVGTAIRNPFDAKPIRIAGRPVSARVDAIGLSYLAGITLPSRQL